MSSNTGVVNIRGKEYQTVALRVQKFREAHPNWSLTSEVLFRDADCVVMKSIIADETGRILATGHAEEIRGATNILKTSAVETCETSAIGRALGVLGLGGTAIASAEEMELALQQQSDDTATGYLIKHNEAVRDYIDHIVAIKQYLAAGDWSLAYEAFAELDPDIVKALWVAPTKGGIFTTGERQQMKSNEWNDARKVHHGLPENDDE